MGHRTGLFALGALLVLATAMTSSTDRDYHSTLPDMLTFRPDSTRPQLEILAVVYFADTVQKERVEALSDAVGRALLGNLAQLSQPPSCPRRPSATT